MSRTTFKNGQVLLVGGGAGGGRFFLSRKSSRPSAYSSSLPKRAFAQGSSSSRRTARGKATAYITYAEPDEQEQHRNATKIVRKMAQSGTNGTVWHKELG